MLKYLLVNEWFEVENGKDELRSELELLLLASERLAR